MKLTKNIKKFAKRLYLSAKQESDRECKFCYTASLRRNDLDAIIINEIYKKELRQRGFKWL